MDASAATMVDGTIRASMALPPRVKGNQRGTLALSIDSIAYYATSRDFAPRRTAGGGAAGAGAAGAGAAGLEAGSSLVRLGWWGEQGGGAVWRPEVHALDTEGCEISRRTPALSSATSSTRAPGSASHATREREHPPLPPTRTVIYPIVVSTNSFTNYLHDAQWLVFELHHFLETDPAQTHRDFLKTLSRAAHANRAWPQTKPPLAHVMLDLAPLAEAMARGEGRYDLVKNLPIIISGVPVGHVSVRLNCAMEDAAVPTTTATTTAAAARGGQAAVSAGGAQLRPDPAAHFGAAAFGHELGSGGVPAQQQQYQREAQPQHQQQPQQAHPSSPQINPFPAPLSSMDPSPHSSPWASSGPSHPQAPAHSESQRRARERHGHGPGPWDPALGQMPPTDRFDMSLAGLIQQAEDVAQGIEESMQPQAVRHAHPRQAQPAWEQAREQVRYGAERSAPVHPLAASESTLRGTHLGSVDDDDEAGLSADMPEAARSHGPPAPASRRPYEAVPSAEEEERPSFASHSFARSAAAAAPSRDESMPPLRANVAAAAAPASAGPWGGASQHRSSLAASASSSHGSQLHRPFSAPPPFADFTPAPADFFGVAPALPPAPVGPLPPPFPGAAVSGLHARHRSSARGDASSFLDEGGLITVWMRLRCVRMDAPAGSATAGALAAAQLGASLKRAAHRPVGPKAAESQQPGSLLVAHYQLFPDVPQARTGPVHAPPSRPGFGAPAGAAWFHHGDACPRVYSSAFLSSLSRGSGIPVEIYAYRSRPSWKDPRDEGGRFVPQAPAQTLMGRASVPLQSLQSLPLSQPPSPSPSMPLVSFLAHRTSFSGEVPLLNPHNPLPEPVGSLTVEIGWGSARDMVHLARIEGGTMAAQKLVRGFLVRRRIRREKIARALAEEEELEEMEMEEERPRGHQQHPQPQASGRGGVAPSAAGLGARSPSFSTPSGSLAPSPRAPSLRSPTGAGAGVGATHLSRSFRDQSSSPLPAPGSARAHQPSFRLNLPLSSSSAGLAGSPSRRSSLASAGAGAASRREMGTSPLPSARKLHLAPSHPQPQHTHAPSLSSSALSPSPSASTSAHAHPFIPAPRAEDKKDFISYNFSRGGGVARSAAQTKEANRAQSVRSLTDSLNLIQQTREALAAAAAGLSVPSTPSTSTRAQGVDRAGGGGSGGFGSSSSSSRTPSHSASKRLQQEQEEQADEERARKFAEDPMKFEDPSSLSLQRDLFPPRPSPARSPPRAPVSSPPRARTSPSISSATATASAAASLRNNVPAASSASGSDSEEEEEEEEEEDYLGEHYSDVDVSEYSDDESESPLEARPVAASPVRPRGATSSPPVRPAPTLASTSAPASAPASTAVAAFAFPLSGLFLPAHASGSVAPAQALDASVARQRLQQQMAELDEMQRRMQWRLSGRRMEDMPPQPSPHSSQTKQTDPKQQHKQQEAKEHPSPPPQQQQPHPVDGARSYSPDRDSDATPSFLSPSPHAELITPPLHPSTPARPAAASQGSFARQVPVTPSTPAPFLSSWASPSPPPHSHAAGLPSPAARLAPMVSAVPPQRSSPPLSAATAAAAAPSPSLARSSSESSIPEELSVQPPPANQELMASPPVLVKNDGGRDGGASSPQQQQREQQEQQKHAHEQERMMMHRPASAGAAAAAASAAPSVSASAPPLSSGASRSAPVNQWLQRGLVSPSRVATHPHHGRGHGGDEAEADADAGAYGSDYGSEVSSGESDDDNDEDAESEWDVRVTGGRDVRVRVEYDPSGASRASSSGGGGGGDPGAASSSSSLSIGARLAQAHERARLFPQGLRSSDPDDRDRASDPSEPGASHSYSAPPPSTHYHAGAGAGGGRWDPNFQPSEEDARRMERIARIMAQSEQ